MVQPYQPAVDEEGEVGLIFLGGTFSHAIHKEPDDPARRRPARRPHRQPGGGRRPRRPTTRSSWAGRPWRRPSTILGPTTYARVDTVRGAEGEPLLLELELLDPLLFFAWHPDKVGGLARVLAERVDAEEAGRALIADRVRADAWRRTMADMTIDGQEDLDGLLRAARVVAEARQEMVAAVAPGHHHGRTRRGGPGRLPPPRGPLGARASPTASPDRPASA